MRSAVYSGVGLFALGALASPTPANWWSGYNRGMQQQCITYNDASTLATNFGLLVSAFSETLANETFTSNLVDYSESANTLIDNAGTSPNPLLSATFTSLANFDAVNSQQPAEPFAVKNLWFTCDTVIVRWESDQSPQPVVGISVLHTVKQDGSAPGTA
jgi:ABC-type transporter Mla subunit MlaD